MDIIYINVLKFYIYRINLIYNYINFIEINLFFIYLSNQMLYDIIIDLQAYDDLY